MKKYGYLSIAILLLIILWVTLCAWLYFNQIPRHETGTDINHQFPLQMNWKIDLENYVATPLAYANNMIFVATANSFGGIWYGLDADSGETLWSKRTERMYLRCVSSRLLVLSSNAGIMVLMTSNGETVWSSDYAEDSATCSKDVVYASGVPRDPLRAFDLYTGKRLWRSTKSGIYGLAYGFQPEELIGRAGDFFYLIDAKKGFTKTRFPAISFVGPDYGDIVLGPIYLVDRGELFAGGTVQDAQTGELIHEENQFSTKYPPTLTPDTMYLSARNAGIVAYDRAGYNVKWIYQPQSSAPLDPVAPVALFDGIGYAIFADNSVRAFNPETGQEFGYWQPAHLEFHPWCTVRPFACDEKAKASLAVSEDTLFISVGDGRVYAFEQVQ